MSHVSNLDQSESWAKSDYHHPRVPFSPAARGVSSRVMQRSDINSLTSSIPHVISHCTTTPPNPRQAAGDPRRPLGLDSQHKQRAAAAWLQYKNFKTTISISLQLKIPVSSNRNSFLGDSDSCGRLFFFSLDLILNFGAKSETDTLCSFNLRHSVSVSCPFPSLSLLALGSILHSSLLTSRITLFL